MDTSHRKGKVQTVLGLIEPSELGVASTHEHVLIDLRCYFDVPEEATERSYINAPSAMDIRGNIGKRWWYNIDNKLLLDESAQTTELRKWYLSGGSSIVDTTSIGIARDPLALARIARATGINIVMGAGYYVPVSYPPDIKDWTECEISETIIRDVTLGVGETGVTAGIIGEIGNVWPTNEISRRVLRAAARASIETGAAISLHPGFHDDALMHHMEDLITAGAEPSRIVMGHVDTMGMEAIRSVLETGAYVQYDTFGLEDTLWGEVAGQVMPTDSQRIERLKQIVEWGYENRILIAHDICFKSMLSGYGGKGYSHILGSIVPRMRKRGFSIKTINNILIKNPSEILTLQ